MPTYREELNGERQNMVLPPTKADSSYGYDNPATNAASTSDQLGETFSNTLKEDTVNAPLRLRERRQDTFYVSAYDYPDIAIDSAYLDSCIRIEEVKVPELLEKSEHIAVSPEEELSDSLIAICSNIADTTYIRPTVEQINIKENYPGFEGTARATHLRDQFWFMPVLFGLFCSLGMVYAFRSKALLRDTKGYFSFGNSVTRNDFESRHNAQYRIFLTIQGLISLSIFSTLVITKGHSGMSATEWLTISLYSLGTLTAFLGLRVAATSYLGYISAQPTEAQQWNHTFLFTIQGLSILLFPAILLMSFGKEAISTGAQYFGFGCVVIAVFLLFCYDLIRFFKNKFSILYLFLYLCTLEFLSLAGIVLAMQKLTSFI
ncbi:MAG: DUF4271 domain-containing protein [Paludibacteraceae bacterium]|nr:DUF4271 domain-containing protein [Paludibacteraceae bacterium]